VLFVISSIPSIPLSAYQTFVLEEKHGFNKTTPTLFVTDLLKSWAIGFVIGMPFLAAFLYVFGWAGDRFVPWLMAFLFGSFFSAGRAVLTCLLQSGFPDHNGHHIPNCDSTTLQQAFTPQRGRVTHKD
jgi:4-hydroxybenzoate polyprenyltransferase